MAKNENQEKESKMAGAKIKIRKSTELKEVLKMAPACKCGACSHGCKMGSGMLAGNDKKIISQFLGISEKELEEKFLEKVHLFNKEMSRPKILRKDGKTFGYCIFYDDKKGCTIHSVKPLQCKTSMGCRDYGEDLTSWFTLNYVVDANDAESVRQYSQFIRSGGKVIEGGNLDEIVPDTDRLKKILSYEIL